MEKKGLVGIIAIAVLNIFISLFQIWTNLRILIEVTLGDGLPYMTLAPIIRLGSVLLMLAWVIYCIVSILLFWRVRFADRIIIFLALFILADSLIIMTISSLFQSLILLFLIEENYYSYAIGIIIGIILSIVNMLYLTRPKVKEQFR